MGLMENPAALAGANGASNAVLANTSELNQAETEKQREMEQARLRVNRKIASWQSWIDAFQCSMHEIRVENATGWLTPFEADRELEDLRRGLFPPDPCPECAYREGLAKRLHEIKHGNRVTR
jgi:hypothetical protein